MSAEVESPSVTVIRSSRGWAFPNFREVWRYRELLYFLVWRDVKVRYKQTVLGAAWAIIQPFFTMVVFSIFFGRFAKVPTDGLPYPALFILCLWDYQYLYDTMGLGSFYEVNIPHLHRLQLDDGMFLDTSLTHGKRIMSSHGPALFSLTHHIVMTRDRDIARAVWPMVRKAVACMRDDHEKDPHGLLRPSWPYDAEMINGYYSSHNYWGLAALRSAIRAARLLGEENDAEAWKAFHDDYGT